MVIGLTGSMPILLIWGVQEEKKLSKNCPLNLTLSLNMNFTVAEAGDRHKSEPDLYIIHANTVNMHQWSNENRKGWLPTRAID